MKEEESTRRGSHFRKSGYRRFRRRAEAAPRKRMHKSKLKPYVSRIQVGAVASVRNPTQQMSHYREKRDNNSHSVSSPRDIHCYANAAGCSTNCRIAQSSRGDFFLEVVVVVRFCRREESRGVVSATDPAKKRLPVVFRSDESGPDCVRRKRRSWWS